MRVLGSGSGRPGAAPGCTDALAVASAALGVPLTDPQPLGGSDRSTVLRCRTPSGSVVVKQYPGGGTAGQAYAREVVGLRTLARTPDLLAADDEHRVLVMTDLGTGPTLADLLLGDDPAAAWDGALQWVEALADTLGLSHRSAAGVEDLPAHDTAAAARTGARRLLADVLQRPDDPALGDELDAIDALDHRDAVRDPDLPAADVVSPTDTCPDNAVRTPDGWRFLDLEGASVHHVAYDAAYAAMPFSTCWCVFDPPPGFTDRLLEHFTAALAPSLPDVVREPGWSRAVDLACASWILAMTGWLIDGADEGRPRVGPAGVPSPSYRQLLASRWRWGADRLRPTLPAVAGLLADAAAWADEAWGASAAPAGPYRAFAHDE